MLESTYPSYLSRHEVPCPDCTVVVYHRPGQLQENKHHVIFYHGACGSSLIWQNQFDQFPECDLYFVDVRGQGESKMQRGLPTFEDAIGDIPLIMDYFGIEAATLVGHSWGGNPLQEYTVRSPQRVRALAIIGTWGQHRVMSRAEKLSLKFTSRFYEVIPWKFMSKTSGRACSDVPQTQELTASAIYDAGRQTFISLGMSAYAKVRELQSYPGNPPMLLMRGAKDMPKSLQKIYDYIQSKNPRAEQVVIPDTVHLPMVDTPERFNEALGGFLKRVVTDGES
ncbi:MAG: alpha/beta hydrolase [Actinomycetaceae bacterium]|nr:alpha/beta hydrolase [Actinomycetaceae bacterium]